MKNFNDIEQLSSYLDGQLNSSDSKRLESRISSDPQLASVLNDMRAARGILRKLPARKAPRNFTLTRKMVGLKPPLPQSYSFFRFSTAFATFLLVLTFAANAILPSVGRAAQTSFAFGQGGGGAPAATELPAATEAPALEAPSIEIPLAATELPSANADAAATETPPAPESTMLKEAETESAPQDQARVKSETIVPVTWQIILLVIILISAVIAFVINQNAKKKWS